MLELDWLLQGFAREHLPRLDAEDRVRFIKLLDYPDATLLDILLGRQAPSDPALARLAERIRRAAAAYPG